MNLAKIVGCLLWLVIMVVLLVSSFIWIMLPTSTYYQRWSPKIRAKFDSSYFGTQGSIILLYTFPILLVAVLGCIVLHLENKQTNILVRSEKTKKPTPWKRPVVVRGPLGILSWIELAFLTMFIALLVWSFTSYLENAFGFIAPQNLKMGEKMWEAKLEAASLRLALLGNICLALLFFPVARGSSILPLFGLTSEGSIKYHIWLGHITMAIFTTHGLGYIVYWASTHQISEMIAWAKTGISNVAGELSLLSGLVMWATTIPKIRRQFFELFFYTHYLYIPFMVFFVLHAGIACACLMLPGFYLFLIDRFLRFLQSRQNVRLVSARVLPCETVELNFCKSPGLTYAPTSTMFVNIPSISKLQWHPFTIISSSNLEPEKLSVLIKTEGAWSRKLHQILSSRTSTIERLAVSVEGPYGPASTHFLRHDALVMVSGGSGITPFISIIRDLIHTSTTNNNSNPPKVTLISAFKNSSDLAILDLLLPLSGTPSGFSGLDIQIKAYVTREKTQTAGNQSVGTIWFKPNVSDAPISPVLGQSNWLWLATIISTSFVIFLLLLGLLTQYYIRPIDHGTNKIYPTYARALWNMFFICLCIAATATAAFTCNKKRYAKEAKQIQNMDVSLPPSSPNSGFYNADREMESLPKQSLVQATKLHFGQRPDLNRMLNEYKESSVGVMVCGPKGMRHDVANICSSGSSAENLHFESISFSW